MSEIVELLPCPFCGGEAHQYGGDSDSCWIRCQGEGCGVELGSLHNGDEGSFAGRAEAIAAWNRRTTAAGSTPLEGKAGKPFFYGIRDKRDGTPHYDELCVASDRGDLEDHIEGDDSLEVIPLYARPAQGAVTEDVRCFLYAFLGSDTWIEAGAIWSGNPELRKAAHEAVRTALAACPEKLT